MALPCSGRADTDSAAAVVFLRWFSQGMKSLAALAHEGDAEDSGVGVIHKPPFLWTIAVALLATGLFCLTRGSGSTRAASQRELRSEDRFWTFMQSLNKSECTLPFSFRNGSVLGGLPRLESLGDCGFGMARGLRTIRLLR